jgi:hypothetical protein
VPARATGIRLYKERQQMKNTFDEYTKLWNNYIFTIREKMIWHRVAARLYMELHPEVKFEDVVLKMDYLYTLMNDDETWKDVEITK